MAGRAQGKMSNRAMLQQLPPGTIGRLLSYLGHYKARCVLVVCFIIISSLVSAASILFIRVLIDRYITPLLAVAAPAFSGLARMLLLLAGVYAVGILANLAYNRMMVTVAQGILKDIRDEMFGHMQRLPLRYFDSHSHGDVMSHYTNDADTLRQMISQSLPQTFGSLMSIVAVFFSMLFVSVWLSLFVIVFIFLLLQVVKFITGRSSGYFQKRQSTIGALNGYVEEMIHGQKVVKVFCHEDAAKAGFDRVNEDLYRNDSMANTYGNILMPTMFNAGYVLYVAIAVVGGALAIGGVPNLGLTGVSVLTLGGIASFLQLSRAFVGPISQVSQQITSVIMALAGAARIFALLDEEAEKDEEGVVHLVNARREGEALLESAENTHLWAWKVPREDGSTELVELRGDIRFYDVDFSYTPGKPVLKDVSLFAKPGQKIALVGATGAGKTTITNLINRFYEIDSGQITYDGIDIRKICKDDLRRSLGMVLQEVSLFTGTVMENIRYGRLDATDKECVEAAKLANADSFIRMLPESYHTVLSGDGSGLSQGQRQLLSIARAAVADPPAMILDEATSSIDTRTEAIVQHGMDRLMEGRTVFVIAHRLSTIMNANAILVLDHGEVIERGDHAQLLEQKGTYYQLYTGAFELE